MKHNSELPSKHATANRQAKYRTKTISSQLPVPEFPRPSLRSYSAQIADRSSSFITSATNRAR
jgi:hypothetical protein